MAKIFFILYHGPLIIACNKFIIILIDSQASNNSQHLFHKYSIQVNKTILLEVISLELNIIKYNEIGFSLNLSLLLYYTI